MSRTLEAVARMCRRMEASSGAGAVRSRPLHDGAGDLVLQSGWRSGNGTGGRCRSFPLVPLTVLLAERAARSTRDVQQLPGVERAPMWARWREAATGLTPEKEGPPRRALMSTAALVHPAPAGHRPGRSWAAGPGSAPCPPGHSLAGQALQHLGQFQNLNGFFK